MTRPSRTRLMILLTFLTPGLASAQSGPLASTPEPGPGDAVALAARAVRLEADRSSWREAARLYRRAASFRDFGDEQAIADRRRAGHLEYYSGAWEAALADFRAAAAMAHETGRLFEAAEDYINAAWVAVRMGDGAQARALMTSAHKLTHSPLLTQEQRRSVLLRVGSDVVAKRDR